MSGEHGHPELEALSARVGVVEAQLEAHGHPYAPADHTHGSAPPPEPPVEPPPFEPGRAPAPVRQLNSESGFTIDSEVITRETPGYGLTLVGCSNFTISNVATLGGGIALFNCKDWTITGGLQEQTLTGNPGWSDNELGLRIDGCESGQILGNVGAYFDCIYQVRRSRNITIDGNFTYNPRGPRWRGQHIQAWELSGTRNQNIDILNHWGLTDYLRPGKWPEMWQEDAISMGHVDQGRISNVLMEMRQLPGGSGSHSGSGLMFEGACSDVAIDNFISIGQANVGFGVASASHVSMRDSLVHYLPTQQRGGEGHVGGFVTQNSIIDFGDNVRIYGAKPRTSTNPGGNYGAWYTSEPDSHYTGSPIFGHSETAEALAYKAAVEPPIQIPDVGFVLPGVG